MNYPNRRRRDEDPYAEPGEHVGAPPNRDGLDRTTNPAALKKLPQPGERLGAPDLERGTTGPVHGAKMMAPTAADRVGRPPAFATTQAMGQGLNLGAPPMSRSAAAPTASATPPSQGQALLNQTAQSAQDLLGESDLTPDEWERIYAQHAKPYFDAEERQHDALERFAIGQGLRFWSGREGEHRRVNEQAARQRAENVMVPLIERREQLRQEAIRLANETGRTVFDAEQNLRGMSLQERAEARQDREQREASQVRARRQDLDEKTQADQTRLAEAELTGRLGGTETLAGRQMTLSEELDRRALRLQETIEQGRLDLAYDELGESRRQFDATNERLTQEFAQNHGLSLEQLQLAREELAQTGRLSDERLAEEIRQFDQDMEERRRQFDELGEQFDDELELRRDQFDRDLNQRIYEFANQYNLSRDQLRETTRQFDQELLQRQQEWMDQFGLSQEELDERIRQFNAGIALDDKRLEEAIRSAKAQETLRSRELFGFTRQDGTHVYGSLEIQQLLQQNDQQFRQMMAAGFTWTDPDTGETRRVMGTDERITAEREYQEMVRTGYDKAATDQNGNPILDENGNPVMEHVMGTQELSQRLQERELALREAGLDADTAHRRAQLEWEQQRYAGFYQMDTISADELGLDPEMRQRFMRADGQVDLAAFFRFADSPEGRALADRLTAFLGQAPTADQVQMLMEGGTVVALDEDGQPRSRWIEGSAGLERGRIDMQEKLQQNGFSQERAEREAREAYENKIRAGYTTVDNTGRIVRVRGTQSHEEYMQGLQNELLIQGWARDDARAEADRLWQEQQRVGYDQVVEIHTPSGPRYVTRHVEGTQEFAHRQLSSQERQAQLERDLIQDGWDADLAREEARWRQAEKSRNGYYTVKDTPSGPREVWVPGSEQHEKTIQSWAHQLTRDGWDAEAALQQARIVSSETQASLDRFQDRFLQERAWQHQQEGMAIQEAHAQAAREWQAGEHALDRAYEEHLTQMQLRHAAAEGQFDRDFRAVEAERDRAFREGENELGRQLDRDLQRMDLEAAERRFEAQVEVDRVNAAIGAVAAIVGNLFSGRESGENVFTSAWNWLTGGDDQEKKEGGGPDIDWSNVDEIAVGLGVGKEAAEKIKEVMNPTTPSGGGGGGGNGAGPRGGTGTYGDQRPNDLGAPGGDSTPTDTSVDGRDTIKRDTPPPELEFSATPVPVEQGLDWDRITNDLKKNGLSIAINAWAGYWAGGQDLSDAQELTGVTAAGLQGLPALGAYIAGRTVRGLQDFYNGAGKGKWDEQGARIPQDLLDGTFEGSGARGSWAPVTHNGKDDKHTWTDKKYRDLQSGRMFVFMNYEDGTVEYRDKGGQVRYEEKIEEFSERTHVMPMPLIGQPEVQASLKEMYDLDFTPTFAFIEGNGITTFGDGNYDNGGNYKNSRRMSKEEMASLAEAAGEGLPTDLGAPPPAPKPAPQPQLSGSVNLRKFEFNPTHFVDMERAGKRGSDEWVRDMRKLIDDFKAQTGITESSNYIPLIQRMIKGYAIEL